ncbi:hypothetical protein Taro_015305 [Colocasia esculenta]|uniref:Uncharacterized protein n=1 Tax=Colocasia esculenta TaxID=4460 RepID=A0A843UKH5_COLES|nr:hypothetical protein [Colocasia esculenta]
MASLKSERPAGSQSQTLFGQTRKEPGKAGDGPARTQASKPAAAKKVEQKPREPKKKLAHSWKFARSSASQRRGAAVDSWRRGGDPCYKHICDLERIDARCHRRAR